MDEQRWIRDIVVNYCQLTVCLAGLREPFNNWTQQHIDQGFTWRPESVSFSTFDTNDTQAPIALEVRADFAPLAQPIRIIMVPFDAVGGDVEITTPVGESWNVTIPAGHHALYFSTEPKAEADLSGTPEWIHLPGLGDAASSDDTDSDDTGVEADLPPSDAIWLYHLTFVPQTHPVHAQILLADNQLSPPSELLMQAEPG